MKFLLVLLAALSIGIAAGIGASFATFHSAGGALTEQAIFGVAPDVNAPRPGSSQAGSAPRISVDSEIYDFGVLENGEHGEHHFVLANDGGSPLTIEMKEISCKCTSADLNEHQKVVIQPGKTFEIKLSWYANSHGDTFRQAARLETDDPGRPELHLIVTGKVVKGVVLEPPSFFVHGLSIGQAGERELNIYSYRDQNFEILSHEFGDGATPEQYELTFTPLKPDQFPKPEIKAGFQAKLKIKPGLPVGSLSQTVTVRTNDPQKGEIKLGIVGVIEGPISIIGPNWNSRSSLLKIGAFSRESGFKSTLILKIIGTKPEKLHPQITKLDPAAMQVKLGEQGVVKQGDRDIVTYPITIEIPPGGPVLNNLGTEQGPHGSIEIDTGDPETGKFRMLVELVTVD